MICFFDTETTGKAKTSNLVELACILTDNTLTPRAEAHLLVKPAGWVIPREATAIHGISQELADQVGLKLRAACAIFQSMTSSATRLAAHNIEYDLGIMNSAFDMIGIELRPWNNLPTFCTMKSSTEICKIPNPYPKFGPYKWPTLQEAYSFFHDGQKFQGAHSSRGDVKACIEVYRKLHNLPAA